MTKKSIAENAWLEGTLHAATGVRFYCIDHLELERGMLGASYGTIDLAGRDGLRRAGRWDGRRPAVALNRQFIAQLARERAEHPSRLTLAVACHEVAHSLDSDPPHFTTPAGSGERQARITKLALTLKPPGIVTAACPWFGHGPRWWRLLFALAYRVERLTGIKLPPAVLSMGRYELPQPAVIRRSFGDEPRRFRRLTIEEM